MRGIVTWRPPLWMVGLLMAVTLALGSGVGYVRGAEESSGNCTEAEDVCQQFSNFWKVWNLAEERFVDPKEIVPDDMIAGAINGMLDSLGDQGHTAYLTPEQAKLGREELSGSFEGIGAYIEVKGGYPVIVSPIEGSPAEAAGILAGDVILRINGQTTEGLSITEIVSRVKGPQGTQVTLQISHAGEETTVDLTITRAAISVPAVTWRMLPNKIAHVRLSQFAEDADVELRKALDAARKQGAKGIVMDLRGNPGGWLEQAVKITSMFVSRGQPVLLEAQRDGSVTTYKSEENRPILDTPMVVLINSGSASSSEIFAGALQDYGRATLIGTPTAGTGTVVSVIGLEDGSELRLGFAQWQTPKGRYLRREGVKPDVTLPLPDDVRPLTPSTAKNLSDAEILRTPDVQLRRALTILGGAGTISAAPSQVWPR